jgi:Fe2+ or Zn2+ uptake regulation protein
MNEASASRVARAILDYLIENPSAQDTLAGITEWWLPGQGVRTQTTTVKDALALLIAEGLIVEVKGKDSQSHYRINEHK